MRLRYLTASVVLVGLVAAVPATSAPPVGPAPVGAQAVAKVEPKSATVRMIRCVSGLAMVNRRATFRASMVALAGTQTMQVRFKVVESDTSGRRAVRAQGLGVWRKSRPGVPRFSYRQRLLALEPGYAYRVVVQYRWYDADGALIASAKRRSAACGQGRKLPNLHVEEALDAGAGAVDGTERYRVTVSNRGRAAAKGVEVALTVDGVQLASVPIGTLAVGESGRAWFVGPPCGALLEAAVDPRAVIVESSEADNELVAPCAAFAAR